LSPADLKKMEGYVQYLEQKGNGEEKAGNYIEAIATYLKLVDVLLVFADAVPSYPQWVKCTTSASDYQKKIKSLIALASLRQKQEEEKVETEPKQNPPITAAKVQG
jgi:hypothetical protein